MNIEDEIKILPCPFCGKIPEINKIGNAYSKSRAVEIHCKGCNTKMKVGAIYHTTLWCEEKAVEQWNKRINTNQ